VAEASLARGKAPNVFLLMEAHFGWVELSNAVMPSLNELSKIYKSRGIDCPLVLMTRVREPLDCETHRWGRNASLPPSCDLPNFAIVPV
jgi:hypothetical protein